jgi:hypothetical protein
MTAPISQPALERDISRTLGVETGLQRRPKTADANFYAAWQAQGYRTAVTHRPSDGGNPWERCQLSTYWQYNDDLYTRTSASYFQDEDNDFARVVFLNEYGGSPIESSVWIAGADVFFLNPIVDDDFARVAVDYSSIPGPSVLRFEARIGGTTGGPLGEFGSGALIWGEATVPLLEEDPSNEPGIFYAQRNVGDTIEGRVIGVIRLAGLVWPGALHWNVPDHPEDPDLPENRRGLAVEVTHNIEYLDVNEPPGFLPDKAAPEVSVQRFWAVRTGPGCFCGPLNPTALFDDSCCETHPYEPPFS